MRGRSKARAAGLGLAVACATSVASAQDYGAARHQLSLVEAMRRAPATSDDLAIARARAEGAAARRRLAESGFFPQVAVRASYDHAFKTEYDDLLELSGLASEFAELPFAQRDAYRFGAVLTQNVFAGGATLAEARQGAANAQGAEIGVSSSRAQAVFTVAEAYCDAALEDQFVAIAEATLEQAVQTLSQIELGVRQGIESEFELLRAGVAVEQQRPVVIQRRVRRDLAYLRLKQLLELPETATVVLTTSLDDEQPLSLEQHARVSAGIAVDRERAPVRQARQELRANQAAVAAARAAYFPRFDWYLSYERVAYPESVLPGGELRTNFFTGLTLEWVLFDGLRTPATVKSAALAVSESEARLDRTRKLAAYESAEAEQQLAGVRAVWQASLGGVRQAERAYDLAELRFEQGLSTELELSDARLELQQARALRAQAARELYVARIRRALLPDLPLSQAAPVAAEAPAVTPSPSSGAGRSPVRAQLRTPGPRIPGRRE